MSNSETSKNTWIIDSGATAHMCNNKGYMYDITPDKSTVSFGSNTISFEWVIMWCSKYNFMYNLK